MTKLQKQLIIKPFIVIFTILYIFALFRFEFIKYITIIVSSIFIVLVLGYFIIKDYKIRGILTEEEYEIYKIKYKHMTYKELKELKENGYEL